MIIQVRVEPIETAPEKTDWVWIISEGELENAFKINGMWFCQRGLSHDPTHWLPDGFPEIPMEEGK